MGLKCTKCNNKLTEEDEFCPECGTKVLTVFKVEEKHKTKEIINKIKISKTGIIIISVIILLGGLILFGIYGASLINQNPSPVCNAPYFEYKSGDCCLDQNNNSVCDIDEKDDEEITNTIGQYCIDNDGGYNRSQKGTAEGTSSDTAKLGNYTDECNEEFYLKEYYCQNDMVVYKLEPCPENMICEEGICVTTENSSEENLDLLLEQYGLNSYYEDAQNAIDTLVEKIDEMEGYGYDVSIPNEYLTNAQKLLTEAEETILYSEGSGSLSMLLNAQTTAEQGMEAKYYIKSSVAVHKAETWENFVSCMGEATYLYQRLDCYDQYNIDDDKQAEIENCLKTIEVGNESDCYVQ